MKGKFFTAGTLLVGLAACNGDQRETVTFDETGEPLGVAGDPAAGQFEPARAVVRNTEGQEIGTVNLTQDGDAVRIDVQLTSLPQGERGFHFHEVGACDPPTFDSAGDHFNPDNRAHGFDHPEGPHVGDLRNLEVGADGSVRTTLTNDLVTLAPGQPNSLLDDDGTAVVVHADPDDYQTQPFGDSGDAIACGVLEPV